MRQALALLVEILNLSYLCFSRPVTLEQTTVNTAFSSGEPIPKAIVLHDGVEPLNQIIEDLKIRAEGQKKGTEWYLAHSKALLNAGYFVGDAADVIREGKGPFLKIFALPLSVALNLLSFYGISDILSDFGVAALVDLIGK